MLQDFLLVCQWCVFGCIGLVVLLIGLGCFGFWGYCCFLEYDVVVVVEYVFVYGVNLFDMGYNYFGFYVELCLGCILCLLLKQYLCDLLVILSKGGMLIGQVGISGVE